MMPTDTHEAVNSSSSNSAIKTRFIIISDTHGINHIPTIQPADVVIHCGDLTAQSKMTEYHASIELLKRIDAPLKLVIAGNHDFTLDTAVFKQKLRDARPSLDPDLVRKEYGDFGAARELFNSELERQSGIVFVDEGSHHFVLENGASLSVFASPFTPSLGDWGFQYHRAEGHEFSIDGDVGANSTTDVVITHGPPRGILDYSNSGQRAGCPSLFQAVAKARPRIHCFGHIHEAWGAKFVTWRPGISEFPSHFTDIDYGKSAVIANLSRLEEEDGRDAQNRCYVTSHCGQDRYPVEFGSSTLFVNAAVQDTGYCPAQLPWVVDIELGQAVNV